MLTDDVPQSSPAVQSLLTLQHFFKILSDITLQHARNNKDARLLIDLSQWPPAIIIDFVYGAAALGKWPASINSRKTTKETYRFQEVRDETARKATAAKAQESVQAHAAQASKRAEASGSEAAAGGEEEQEMNQNDMMDIVVGLPWLQQPMSRTQPPSLPCPEDVSTEKVAAWLHEQ
jgi:hypothetical protein